MRSEADAINLNRILPILILFYLYINILHLFFINCEVWKFSKIRPMYDKCMTNQKENRVADNCNAVLVRSEADSNRCTRFCRPLPSHSAIRPNRRSLILRNIPDREYLETPDTPANPPCRQLRTIRSVLRLQIYKHFSFLQNLSGNFRFSLKNPYLYVEFHPSFSRLGIVRTSSALRAA